MSLRFKSILVRRMSPGEYTGGFWVEGADTTMTLTASVHPLTPEEMALLPEGRRNGKTFTVFTSEQLFPAIRGAANADQVTYAGTVFEVMSCAAWQNGVISHYKSVIAEMEIQGN